MTPEEEVLFTDKLTKQFILIPKSRLYHCIGGALAFVVVAFGITIGSAIHYLNSEPAEIARRRIMQIRTEVEEYQKNLGADKFVKTDKDYHIKITGKGELVVKHNSRKNGVAIVFATSRKEKWQFVPASQ
jgi:hypothetical protein